MSAPELATAAAPAPRRPARTTDVKAPEAPRHLRLVGEEELAAIRRRRWLRIGAGVVTAFVIALLSAAVWMHVVLAQNQVRLDALKTRADTAQTQYQQLRLQVDQLSSPARILGIAEDQLHMAAPSSVTYMTPGGAAAATSGPSAATPPADWSTIKPHLAAGA
ncbi:MAG: hypothetical protein ACRDZ8_02385 [Acidimicrobiales bacterium]